MRLFFSHVQANCEYYLSNLNTAEKYATVVGLSCVNKDNLEIVRDFVSELGQEFVSIFDSIWCSGNEERLEIIAEMKMNQKVKKLYVMLC